jgi:hypothetical protein
MRARGGDDGVAVHKVFVVAQRIIRPVGRLASRQQVHGRAGQPRVIQKVPGDTQDVRRGLAKHAQGALQMVQPQGGTYMNIRELSYPHPVQAAVQARNGDGHLPQHGGDAP